MEFEIACFIICFGVGGYGLVWLIVIVEYFIREKISYYLHEKRIIKKHQSK